MFEADAGLDPMARGVQNLSMEHPWRIRTRFPSYNASQRHKGRENEIN